jgi:aminoglycoside N3'-acetyltransferase
VAVTISAIGAAIQGLGLSGRPLCVHASLRSFGWIDGGAQAIVDGLLAEGCTVLVPTFSWDAFIVDPLPHQQPSRNGALYVARPGERAGTHRSFRTDTMELDRADMGALPAAVLAIPGRVRGDHPLCSFSAVGPLARSLVDRQAPLRVTGPLEALVEADGAVVLMGVGVDAMTLLHLAEERAGRNLFRRWANDGAGRPMEVAVGGCSQGFPRLTPILEPCSRDLEVGQSRWRAYDARRTLDAAAAAMRRQPTITRCDKPSCRCDDAILGGPLLGGPLLGTEER